jgi:hypothetical protein
MTITLRSPLQSLLVAAALTLATAVPVSAPLAAQEAAPFDAIGDAAARTALRTLIADAAAKGLPTAPLVTKVREGLAKRATPDRIRSATSLLVDRLTVAADALAPSRAPDELTAGADALQAGIPAGTLREMRRMWPGKPLTVPLGVLSEMVANGVSQTVATRRVRELLVKGASTAQLAALGTNVESDIAAGLAPDAAMELRSKGVLNVLTTQAELGISAPVLPPRPPVRKK